MSSNRGFTLIELIISITILGLVVMGAVTSMSSGSDRNISDQHNRRARMVADSILETKSYSESGYSTMASTSFTTVIDERGAGTADNLNGTVAIVVVPDSLTGTNNLKVHWREVRVTVHWTESNRQASKDTVFLARRVCQL